MTSPGKLIGHLSLLRFELRLGGPAFDSKKQASGRNTGGLYSSDAVLTHAGGTWSHQYTSGWNVYKIHFDGAPIADGDADDLAE